MRTVAQWKKTTRMWNISAIYPFEVFDCSPLKSCQNPIGKDRLPSTIFEGRAVKLPGCKWFSVAILKVLWKVWKAQPSFQNNVPFFGSEDHSCRLGSFLGVSIWIYLAQLLEACNLPSKMTGVWYWKQGISESKSYVFSVFLTKKVSFWWFFCWDVFFGKSWRMYFFMLHTLSFWKFHDVAP